MRFLLTLSYNGRNYSGWQKQKNAKSVQEIVENALKTLLKQDIEITASGRTDAGVSAYGQVAHFDYEKDIDFYKFKRSINGILPDDIKVLFVCKKDFHARFSAKRKTYLYKMYMSDVELPLFTDGLCISLEENVKTMKKFLKLIVGTHDFAGFQAKGSPTSTTVRTIYSAKLVREGSYLNFYITGNGFLYKMVRNIVGTMLACARNVISFDELKKSIFKDYVCKFTAKSQYLYLYNVVYD